MSDLFQAVVEANDREIEMRRKVRDLCTHGRAAYQFCAQCELDAMAFIHEQRLFAILDGLAQAVEKMAGKL